MYMQSYTLLMAITKKRVQRSLRAKKQSEAIERALDFTIH
jgi:hypothetical protein